VYLNFDGQRLTRGPSDATQNQASWMQVAAGTAPRYQTNNADRDTAIKTIVDGVRAQLSQFPITVTTTRPATGNYVMIVFGGRSGAVGSNFGGAVNQLDCGDTRPNDVAWISDNVSPAQAVINSAVGAIGFGLGLTATSAPADCMCGWANDCSSDDSAPCKLGSPVDRDPKANQLCPDLTNPDLTPQDEVAVFHTAFLQLRSPTRHPWARCSRLGIVTAWRWKTSTIDAGRAPPSDEVSHRCRPFRKIKAKPCFEKASRHDAPALSRSAPYRSARRTRRSRPSTSWRGARCAPPTPCAVRP